MYDNFPFRVGNKDYRDFYKYMSAEIFIECRELII